MSCPDIGILGKDITFTIQARSATGTPVDTDSLPTYKIYEETTNTEIASGTMAKLDDTDTDGYYAAKVATTTAIGYEVNKTYTIRVESTISSIAVVKTFSFIVLGQDDVVSISGDLLTTTARFKDFKGISVSTYDSLIATLIARATSAIQRFCNRDFVQTTYREFYDGDNQCELALRNYPIISISMLGVGKQDAFSITNTSSDAYNAQVSISDTAMTLDVMGGANDGTSTLTLADYTTLTALFTAIDALGTGWSVTQNSELNYWAPIELLPTSKGLACLDKYAYLQIPDEPEEEFTTDNKAGVLKFFGYFPRGFQNIVVRYTAGYATIPGDLEQICIDLVDHYYSNRQLNTSLKREKIGDYEYENGMSGSSGTSGMPVHIKQRLIEWSTGW